MIETPALRARHLGSQYALQQTVVDALRDGGETDPPSRQVRQWRP
ncbi:hypothetical protein [Luteipulveratus halotolerans]|nr:hypothetical protein [Luteipulveratus halotolerans]